MNLPARVHVYEVGPRDGLQNESARLPVDDKVALVEALADAGLPSVEIGSFVRPEWIPQLGDTDEVARRVRRREGTAYSALVPNRRGLERALAAGLTEVAVFLSASETHNKKNVNKSIDETLRAFDDVIGPARDAGVRVRAYVSTVYGCPYEGDVSVDRVCGLVTTLRGQGVSQVSLGDTIGVADPAQVERVLGRVLEVAPAGALAMHFHDTRGTALANVVVGLGMGIATVDSSVGGMGGCPYAPGAAGNLATEDLVWMLGRMGVETGVELGKVVACAERMQALLGRELPSKVLHAEIGARRRAESRTGSGSGSTETDA